MKAFRLQDGLYHWGDTPPSPSFLKKLSEFLTQELCRYAAAPGCEEKIAELAELCFCDRSNYGQILPMCLKQTDNAFVIAQFYVLWSCQEDLKVQPQSDVSEKTVVFFLVLPPTEQRALREFLKGVPEEH